MDDLFRTCRCGKSFSPRVYQQVHCSSYCRLQADASKRSKGWASRLYYFHCKQCEKVFIRRATKRKCNQFCTRECAYEFKKAEPDVKGLLPPINCIWCGLSFHPKMSTERLCGPHCRQDEKAWTVRTVKACVVCGKREPTRHSNTCGHACHRVNHRLVKNRGKCKRKAIKRACVVGKYKAIDVYKRDKWICHLCGVPIDRSAVSPHPLSQSIDHVVPLANGGSDTFDNVRCAHRSCNVFKRDVPDNNASLERNIRKIQKTHLVIAKGVSMEDASLIVDHNGQRDDLYQYCNV